MKTFISIEGFVYNLDMLVSVVPYGPRGTEGYHLSFCDKTFVSFKFVKPPEGETSKAVIATYYDLEATATAIRSYLFDRTILVVPGPYRRDEGDY